MVGLISHSYTNPDLTLKQSIFLFDPVYFYISQWKQLLSWNSTVFLNPLNFKSFANEEIAKASLVFFLHVCLVYFIAILTNFLRYPVFLLINMKQPPNLESCFSTRLPIKMETGFSNGSRFLRRSRFQNLEPMFRKGVIVYWKKNRTISWSKKVALKNLTKFSGNTCDTMSAAPAHMTFSKIWDNF